MEKNLPNFDVIIFGVGVHVVLYDRDIVTLEERGVPNYLS